MPFSFTQIEQEKSNVIHAAMATLALIYFIFFYSVSILLRMFFYKWMLIEMPESGTGLINVHYRVDLLSLPEIIFILGLAIFIAFFHWSISTR
ncbi:MAG: hypothetical protein Q7S13_01530, partial [Candidatus Omnitrophota bacterium]|nr:hypothetical protein [Candidatus Omnitrophota bacterium]